ncbi:MAG: hypothetical protein OQK78_01415 [Gammaproteobacteria bacterium]|nr:hypothetical protein [Gammaproteobacteria bacterium]MCW8888990.1 hypothetical protein [Gammaproteobacteria bacterium]MCW8983567.1 hypothetical protein [Gammaproteobacteria bacterium]
MTVDILMHINEPLSEHQRRNLMISLGNRRGGLESHFQSRHPQLMFIAYDRLRTRPHELLRITSRAGYRARLVA